MNASGAPRPTSTRRASPAAGTTHGTGEVRRPSPGGAAMSGPMRAPPGNDGPCRRPTPTRSRSNTRSASATKRTISAQAGRPDQPAAAPFMRRRRESPPVRRPHHRMGRRKLQRWINAHFLEQGVAMTHDVDLSDLTVSVKWRSNMEKLFLPENADVLEMIRTNTEREGVPEPEAAPVAAPTAHATMLARYSCVDKRLRPFLDKEWRRDAGDFLRALEAVLLHFLSHTDAPDEDEVGPALADTLELPPHMADDSSKQHGTMVLIFDGAYQRMLTHAMCQYYGLVSTSKTQNDGTRTLSVTVGKAAERLSRTGIVKLSAYLAQRAADAAATPHTCTGAGAGAGAGAGSRAGAHGVVARNRAMRTTHCRVQAGRPGASTPARTLAPV